MILGLTGVEVKVVVLGLIVFWVIMAPLVPGVDTLVPKDCLAGDFIGDLTTFLTGLLVLFIGDWVPTPLPRVLLLPPSGLLTFGTLVLRAEVCLRDYLPSILVGDLLRAILGLAFNVSVVIFSSAWVIIFL